MPLPSARATLKIAWRSRHLALGPWERIEAIRGTFGLGLASLLACAILGATTLLALLVALIMEPWRSPALWTALGAAILALGALALGLWLLLAALPRRIRALLTWARDTPANMQSGAAEFRRIVDDVEREERARHARHRPHDHRGDHDR